MCEDLLGEPTDITSLFTTLEHTEGELESFSHGSTDEEVEKGESATTSLSASAEGDSGACKKNTQKDVSELYDLVLDVCHEFPIPRSLKTYVLAADKKHQMAERIRAILFIAPHIDQYSSPQLTPTFIRLSPTIFTFILLQQ